MSGVGPVNITIVPYLYIILDVATVSCRFDVIDLPFDTQNCSVQYASWMYLADQILLIPIETPVFSYYIENDEWTLRSFTKRSENWAGASSAFYDIKITREPNYYITTFIWPTFLINCLSIIGIFSPFCESGKREEKVTMGLTTLLTMAVILMIVAGDMPSADSVPLLGNFIILEIGLASLASVVSVFVIHMHGRWMNGTPVPKWLMLLTCQSRKERHDSKSSVKSTQSTSKQAWQNKNHTDPEVKTDPKQLVSNAGEVETRKKHVKIDEHQPDDLHREWGKVAGRIDSF